eukprot:540438-Rhodomonas_salina.5
MQLVPPRAVPTLRSEPRAQTACLHKSTRAWTYSIRTYVICQLLTRGPELFLGLTIQPSLTLSHTIGTTGILCSRKTVTQSVILMSQPCCLVNE